MSPDLFLYSRGEVRLDPDPRKSREGGGWGGVGGNKGNGNTDDAKEKDAARSFISFSSEKETEEPWPPPLLSLRDIMMDPDLE